VLLSHFDLLCSSSRVRSREPDELVLNFNIQDVILLADYNAATELNAVTFFDVIGVEPKEVVRNADLQDILEGSKEVDEKEIWDIMYSLETRGIECKQAKDWKQEKKKKHQSRGSALALLHDI
jgi:hypothetical protein